jgi:hypothetical protein
MVVGRVSCERKDRINETEGAVCDTRLSDVL